MRKTVVAALLLAALPAAALSMDDHIAVQPNALKWGPAPPGLPPGARVAVLSGNPGSDGPYVVRARLPGGYKIAPHTHPTDEDVTVLSGVFHIAMGDKFDAKKGETPKRYAALWLVDGPDGHPDPRHGSVRHQLCEPGRRSAQQCKNVGETVTARDTQPLSCPVLRRASTS